MNVPQNLRYNSSHEWVLLEGDVATIGISDHAQEELTDVVFVELPPVGKTVDAGDPTAVVESVKAASDIYVASDTGVFHYNGTAWTESRAGNATAVWATGTGDIYAAFDAAKKKRQGKRA